MRRFRTQSLALFGALVILSLSISSVFAARPVATDASSTVGSQVATFVHLLVSGSNDETTADDEQGQDENTDNSDECQPTSDENGTEDGTTEDGTTDEDAADESGEEDTSADECTDQSDEDSSNEDSTDDSSNEDSGAEDTTAPTAQNHGQCVAEVARDMTQLGENETHGWAVALAAQVTCWLELNGDQSGDTGDENSGTNDGSGTDEEGTDDTSPASTRPHGKSEAAHQHKLDAGHGKPTWAASSTHGGQGKGHGHGH